MKLSLASKALCTYTLARTSCEHADIANVARRTNFGPTEEIRMKNSSVVYSFDDQRE